MNRYSSSDIVIYATDFQGNMATITTDRDFLLEFAVARLLPLYNSHWRDSRTPALDREEFLACLGLPSSSLDLMLDDSGYVRVPIETGELFLDHSAHVLVDRTGTPQEITIE